MKLERAQKTYLIEFTAQELRELIYLIHPKHEQLHDDVRAKYLQALQDIRDEKVIPLIK